MVSNGLAQEAFVNQPGLEEVATLMVNAWDRPCWHYTAPMLEGYLHRPAAEPALSLGYRCGAELAGYMACVPCPAYYGGRTWRMVFASFWTALGRYALKSIPLHLHCELHHQACVAGYQGLLTIGEEGGKGLRAFELVTQRLETPYRTLARFGMLIGSPRLARRRVQAGRGARCVRPYGREWSAQCAALAADVRRRTPLARVYSEAELDFALRRREGSRAWIWMEDGLVRGLIGGWRQEVLGARTHLAVQLDHALLEGLEPGAREEFLGAILLDPYWAEVESINLPLMGYFDEEPFRQAGFMKTQRTFQLNYQPLEEGPALEPVERFYLEFF